MQRFVFINLILACIIFITGCSRKNGKIEDRFGSYYLVNKSSSKKYRFTVKRTEIQDNKFHTFSTELIELSPGDERLLGPKSFKTNIKYPVKEKQILDTYKPLTNEEINIEKERIKKEKRNGTYNPFVFSKLYFEELFMHSSDTIINGQKLKYRFITEQYNDTLHPFPIKFFRYEYDVTGQVEIKEK